MERDSAPDRYTRRHVHFRWMPLCVLLLAGMTVLLAAAPAGATGAPEQEYDPAIAAMLAEIDESELENTTYDLQNFSTRVYGSAGNREAGEYLYRRLADIPGLEVEFRGGELNNVVATLPGSGNNSDGVVVVGAHYDSTSSDPDRAPGATDNGGGVAIVLELARVMSRHSFNRTVEFAFWNAEEIGRYGSADYAGNATIPVVLYFNYDSACYDPMNRSVLDIVYDERSADIAALMAGHNTLYGLNFTLTGNNHTCASDHIPFRARGYPAVTTHCEEHGPAHTPDDTIDHVSFGYAKRNAGLGLSVLAEVAGLRDGAAIQKAPMILWNLSGRLDGAG
ncbi:M28 family metallopeptidase [Methanoculleus oceani]|uniref:Zn-dependent exopeptidase M28 n=1 Tax=Methanoculleus oceani TaxID=2184756 RepID=A0ABD4TD03_9EURY|nr:M28 family metallopeptidase [Methanoculleus sp. CWC-02]MCM2464909.1 Zn-dependent exopeptidase M28 [Methanoculleus sp. CWC-02]